MTSSSWNKFDLKIEKIFKKKKKKTISEECYNCKKLAILTSGRYHVELMKE